MASRWPCALAEDSTNLILTQDIFGLYQNLRTTLETNPDVRYVFLLDVKGQVIAHSFPSRVPPDLLTVNVLQEGVPWQVQILQSEEGLITDVAVLIFEGRLGTVRLGLSHRRMEQAIWVAQQRVMLTILAALLVGGLMVLVLTRVLTRPIMELVEAARAVGRGDLSVRPPVRMEDEVGELTAAFNAMTRDLERFRDELLRQNRELSTLNAVAQAISGRARWKRCWNGHCRKPCVPWSVRPDGWCCLRRKSRVASWPNGVCRRPFWSMSVSMWTLHAAVTASCAPKSPGNDLSCGRSVRACSAQPRWVPRRGVSRPI